jgi:hypothetical protein
VTQQSDHQHRVETLVLAYRAGRNFPTTAKVRDYLQCNIVQAYRADIDARNELNADPTTPKVVPAAKVRNAKRQYVRRSNGNADSDLERLTAFGSEVTTKASHLTHQAVKVSNKHPNDLDLMRFARDAATLGQQAVALKIEIERIRNSRP